MIEEIKLMLNFNPIEFDGIKGVEFETFRNTNTNFNYPEFGVIKTKVVELDHFKMKNTF